MLACHRKLRLLACNSNPALAKEISDKLGIPCVKATEQKKCCRCWHYVPSVGNNAEHPELCERCLTNLFGAGEVRTKA